MIWHLTEVLPFMPTPRWVRNLIQPIAIRDVLHDLLASARVDAQVNRALDAVEASWVDARVPLVPSDPMPSDPD